MGQHNEVLFLSIPEFVFFLLSKVETATELRQPSWSAIAWVSALTLGPGPFPSRS